MRNALIAARGDQRQADVADAIGVSQKYISKLELGKGVPSLKIAYKIADYYGESIDQLFPDLLTASDFANE
ncbi:MAG: helix-turn-helix domain-containing protein [Bacteroidales bacterium]|nr:helix-turn-helix domain-containing protein [Bacteroidales bacterium]